MKISAATVSLTLVFLTGCVISIPQNTNRLDMGMYSNEQVCILSRADKYQIPDVPSLENVTDEEIINELVEHITKLREDIFKLTGEGC